MVIFIRTHHGFSFFGCFQTGAQIIVRQSVGREVPVFGSHTRTYPIIVAITYHCTDLMILDACREVGHPFEIVVSVFIKVTARFSGNARIDIGTISRRNEPSVELIHLIL